MEGWLLNINKQLPTPETIAPIEWWLSSDITAKCCYDQAVAPCPRVSEEQLKAFWEAIQADTALQQKLQGVTDPEAYVAIAKEAGFMISADELRKEQEIIFTDEVMKGISGGEYCCKATNA